MAVPQLPQQELDAIHELGKTILASRVALMAGIGIMFADYMNTLTREVQFYWRGRISIPRILYFVIRYVNFPIQILNAIGFFNPPSDKIYVNTQLALDLSLIWAVQAILIFRLRAVYGSRSLAAILWLFLSLVVTSEGGLGFVGINIDSYWMAQPIASLAPNLRYCAPNRDDFLQRTHYLTWVPTLVFDSIIFLLSLLKFIQIRTQTGAGVFKKSLMHTLLHDSIVYFALLLIMAIAYMIVARINVENGEPASNVIFPLISAAGCRLLFHIRSKERAQVLGIGNTSFRNANGAAVFSEDVAATRPIEFKVFSIQEREAPQDRIDDIDEEEMMGDEGDYPPCGDCKELESTTSLKNQERMENEDILDPPRRETEPV